MNTKLEGNIISTSLYLKPTDAHLYLNAKSCHPRHVIKNLPKGQFIRIRRICSDDADFDRYASQTKKYFVQRGFTEKQLQHTVESVKKMSRDDLLMDRERTPDKDPHAIFVCTWHPKLRGLSSVLDKNYEILKNDPTLSKIFDKKPIVAFRRKRNLRNILCKNDK